MRRFAASHEVRALATVDLARYALGALRMAERRRGAETLDAPWVDRGDVADGLLMLSPALIQVFAALSDGWAGQAQRDGWLIGLAGAPDSCWMWRREGALQAARTPEDPSIGGR